MTTFGQRLKRLRELRKWSQKELAELAGVPYETINRVERGKHENPRLEVAVKLSKALGVSLDVLAGVYDESEFKAAVQAWRETWACTADDALVVEGIEVTV